MPIYLILIFFAVVTVAISAFGYERWARPGRVYERLGEAVEKPAGDFAIDERPKGREFKLLQTVGGLVPVSADGDSLTQRMLTYAGYRSERALQILYGIKVLGGALGAVIGMTMRNSFDNRALHIVFPVIATLAGYFGPGFILEKKVKARQDDLRLSLPDALDLMVIAVEAGLGLDQAIRYVSTELREAHPALAEDLSMVNLEIRAGKRRAEALKNLANRTGERELRKLTAILIQNDRFGTGVAESLRNHSDFMRVRRRQEAEERAAKVGVKLVFPIFFFILPAMMMVCAGPGVLQVIKYLIPLMKGF